MKLPVLSVVIPIYNEEGNIKQLYSEIKEVMDFLIKNKQIKGFEVIFINDGSKDNSQEILENLKKKEKQKIKIIVFRKNFGQTPSLKAGFDNSKGDLIVTMDGDLQNDPKDILKLMKKLSKGYDVVSGWRYKRKDSFSKKISSRLMNGLRMTIIGDNLHDYGCSLKIYKRKCLQDLELFGELHRYITAYLYIKGYKIGEVIVNHRERKSGKTKYKQFNRGINGILDLFYLKFWSDFSHKPLHFFGKLGFYQWVLAGILIIEQIIKAYIIKSLELGPVLMLAVVFGISGLLFIMFGFLFETISREYFKERKIYSIKKII
jgi:glycosyltransferase involved in cell wall biosynthesis